MGGEKLILGKRCANAMERSLKPAGTEVRSTVPSVASITVTWNGSDTIAQHLAALAQQRAPLAEIIIVDNNSTDNTCEIVARDSMRATLLRLRENTGVGAGLSAGLEYALGKDYDWFWLFDQDTLPEPGALEALLSTLAELPDGLRGTLGVLASLPVDPQYGVQHWGHLWRGRFVRIPPEKRKASVCWVDSVISSGSLIRREVVENVGLPRADFFIDFVDHEYNLRIRQHGYKIALIPGSVVYHQMGQVRPVKRVHWGRVRVRGFEPTWRYYYISRNETFTVWHLVGSVTSRLFFLGRLLRRAASILCYDEDKLGKLRMHFAGFLDGLRKDLSRRGPLGTANTRT